MAVLNIVASSFSVAFWLVIWFRKASGNAKLIDPGHSNMLFLINSIKLEGMIPGSLTVPMRLHAIFLT